MPVPTDGRMSNGPETPPYLEGAFETAKIGQMEALHRPGKYPVEIRWHGRGGQGAMTAGSLSYLFRSQYGHVTFSLGAESGPNVTFHSVKMAHGRNARCLQRPSFLRPCHSA